MHLDIGEDGVGSGATVTSPKTCLGLRQINPWESSLLPLLPAGPIFPGLP